MSIEILKLVNGETLLTEVTHDDDRRFHGSQIHIIDPVQMTVHTRQTASPVCICTIWVPLTKATNLFSMDHSHILVRTVVDEDMIVYYNRCLETIRESMEDDSSATFFSNDNDDNEMLTPEEIQKVFDKLLQPKNTANTAMH